MARDFKRTDRVGDQIQRDLATLIQREIKDPRIGMVTINHVKVAKDLGYADVYITVLPLGEQDEAEATKQSLEVLKQAAGFLRAELAKGISLRVMPALRFHYDESIHRGRHLTSLIEKARRLEDNEG
ncbi:MULTISPECIES: 30S ribosome-binding factor RbfA [unclassified Marinobacterium]|jgi:ribosome-binding factor A|uniref:30S ribosome-binding factor RbfA n=1 Tax=unclassified Marinobacterium TaxID=2644139 RepID=UPI00014E4749|nr:MULTISPECIES: 30S ribosome-binding factor RbfA [unclassified Marinobacterium]NRP09168.1 Ribosome-binding factor A [Marinobacterium sp. xm-g-48]NRP15428.1 Ribosome-binding factor A [Marinobacterium sp. xm-a-152]NRP26482.1 Ribosome-binding factor A [Marinobacterium sp. xm-d-420]NRP35735.1 Ribosome-binding factor A [Marinobacterium sp. xm-d-579]NRP37492.1 Ribosome-binding factor A [Marinobacterium sp. xm-a-121]